MFTAPHRALPAAALALSVLVRAAAIAAMPAPEAASGDHSRVDQAPGPSAVCLEAVVSPVSGFAECVNPRGAPVAPPPPRPQPPPPCEAADGHCAGDAPREPQAQR